MWVRRLGCGFLTGFLSELVPQDGAWNFFVHGLDALGVQSDAFGCSWAASEAQEGMVWTLWGSKMMPLGALGQPLRPKEAKDAIQEVHTGSEEAKKEGPRRPDSD